ncbi:MAG: DinB family protein [Actinobacteria bacterium]|nr:DinB family protein [Actinomycetota bacterium]MBV9662786.1 DinB family protein [Actinomycetota bacterium]
MAVERTEPPFRLDERTMLEAWLEYHRATLELKCEGLSVEQLREQSVPPSSLSLLGLVRHMAEVERAWFRRTLADEDVGYIYVSDDDEDADFDDVPTANPDEAFATWRAECDHARENAAAVDSLDAVGKRARRNGDVSLRWIYVHMIEEYARHNGHADLLRERIDGATGD